MSSLGSNWGAFLAWNRAVSVIPQWGWWHFVRVSEPKDESNPSMIPDFALEGRQEALSFLEVSFGNRAGHEPAMRLCWLWHSTEAHQTLGTRSLPDTVWEMVLSEEQEVYRARLWLKEAEQSSHCAPQGDQRALSLFLISSARPIVT